MAAFDQAFAIVVGEEGGYCNDPGDPGGETKFGISKRAYPHEDIARLTVDQAKAIYRRDYWTPMHGDDLPPPLALLAFDAAVNNGVARAVRWLQAAVGTPIDGKIGPHTLACARARDVQASCTEMLAQRIDFMGELPTWPRFGLGWSRRLAALPYHAIKMTAA